MSDIHANPVAFRKAVEDASKMKVEAIYALGDIVGYGYDPCGAIRIAREYCDVTLKGNHDAALVGEISISDFSPTARDGVMRHRCLVGDEDRKWIDGLPYKLVNEEHGFAMVHGTLDCPEMFNYLNDTFNISLNLAMLMDRRLRILFAGHTHAAMVVWCDKSKHVTYELDSDVVKIEDGSVYIVNVGSVGYPRVNNYTAYIIYDTDAKTVTYRKLAFDFDGYVRNLQDHDITLPLWLQRTMGELSYKRIAESERICPPF